MEVDHEHQPIDLRISRVYPNRTNMSCKRVHGSRWSLSCLLLTTHPCRHKANHEAVELPFVTHAPGDNPSMMDILVEMLIFIHYYVHIVMFWR